MPPPGQADYRPDSYNPYAASLSTSASASALTSTTSTPASAFSALNTTAPKHTEEDPMAVSAGEHDHEMDVHNPTVPEDGNDGQGNAHDDADPEDTFNLLPKLRSRLLSATPDDLGLYTTPEESEESLPDPSAGADASSSYPETASPSAVPAFDPQQMYQAISAYSNTPPIQSQSQSQSALQSLSTENTPPGTALGTKGTLSGTKAPTTTVTSANGATSATSYFAAEEARRELERETKATEKKSTGSKLGRAGTLLSRSHNSAAKASMGSATSAAATATSSSVNTSNGNDASCRQRLHVQQSQQSYQSHTSANAPKI
ncbi:hypothetical protein AAP_05740 [Ascosphaera apis ARSEF 7405]|uniref:Uncharacterized protein n=1 Tax=Ascosphaera apis ARSEF 7405 TaxID=392613 RepID=A0A167VD39_9EURO|nr:hypothetical protein AAP_05740 [Ascosphaera apis ARSEF 7405]